MTIRIDLKLAIEEFEQFGFYMARRLFAADEMQALLKFARGDSQLAQEAYVRKDASGGQSKLALRNDLDDRSPYTAIVRSHRIATTMQELLGDEVYHYHHKMMLKEPLVGGAWEWHQDYGYWYNNGCLYPDMASCLIAVDRATQANGCLQVLRGSHRIGRIEHFTTGDQKGADAARVAQAIQRHELVFCEMEPGDALFFHGNLLHSSSKNLSHQPRWSLICCYNTKHNDPYITDGRHPNYSRLEIWEDDRVHQELLKQL
ncbi:MAG: phytanoyl-CoA dioxygenase family protein [Planctomycetaceae bacterium]|jgi:ectoine hydroxylase-related dioxygenase (phytanoyl-CoA dioxygenase family)|nr:phytanoyl-CoA dioxygenase family protein [Planctomycetaceae bacterium]